MTIAYIMSITNISAAGKPPSPSSFVWQFIGRNLVNPLHACSNFFCSICAPSHRVSPLRGRTWQSGSWCSSAAALRFRDSCEKIAAACFALVLCPVSRRTPMSGIPMHMPSSSPRLWVFLIGIALFALSGWAAADPPSRAARLGYMSGAVSFSPAGENDWVQAAQNRPLTSGDRLWADADARAEVQVGGAALRMGASTSVTLLNLDDSIGQVQLNQGVLKIRVRRLGPGQAY